MREPDRCSGGAASPLAAKAAVILLVVMLAGCTRYYYNKPGASYDHLATDHSACVGDVGIRSSSREYVQVSPEAYRRCMLGQLRHRR